MDSATRLQDRQTLRIGIVSGRNGSRFGKGPTSHHENISANNSSGMESIVARREVCECLFLGRYQFKARGLRTKPIHSRYTSSELSISVSPGPSRWHLLADWKPFFGGGRRKRRVDSHQLTPPPRFPGNIFIYRRFLAGSECHYLDTLDLSRGCFTGYSTNISLGVSEATSLCHLL